MAESIVRPEELSDAMTMLAGIPMVEIQPPTRQVIRDKDGGYHAAEGPAWVKFSTAFRDSMSDLKGARLSVFLCICLHVGETGKAWPGIRTICRLTGYKSAAVVNAISELEAIPGLLEVTRRPGKTSLYRPSYVSYGRQTPYEKRNTSTHEKRNTPPIKSETEVELGSRTNQVEPTLGARKPRAPAPYMDNPAVQAYREKFLLTPHLAARQAIADKVIDLPHWQATLDRWALNRYNPQSVGSILEAYEGQNGNGGGAPAGTPQPPPPTTRWYE